MNEALINIAVITISTPIVLSFYIVYSSYIAMPYTRNVFIISTNLPSVIVTATTTQPQKALFSPL